MSGSNDFLPGMSGWRITGPDGHNKRNNVALSLNCSSEEEINTFFSNISEGGKIIDPLKVQFWGAIFGMLTDQFGINWMFNYDKKQKK
jgi:PhnB protein